MEQLKVDKGADVFNAEESAPIIEQRGVAPEGASEMFFCKHSSNIRSVTYYPDSTTLMVTFVNGVKYMYSDVPSEVYYTMKQLSDSSESVGSYFYTNVRTSFPYSRI